MRDAGIEPARHLAVVRQWVMNAVAGLAPDLIVVDTFPGGSFGELLPVLETVPARVLVARAVKDAIAGDDAYRALLPLVPSGKIVPDERGVGPILLREREELMSRRDARAALGLAGDGGDRKCVYLTLGGGGDELAPRVLPELTDRLVARGWHVVVGAGPLYLGDERRGPHITWIDRYVPLELLQGADAAVSAGGYNSVTELMFAGVPTVFLPQPTRRRRSGPRARRSACDAGAGRLARSARRGPGSARRARRSRQRRAGWCSHNGARAAAAEVLGAVLPAADVAFATSACCRRSCGRVPRSAAAVRSTWLPP